MDKAIKSDIYPHVFTSHHMGGIVLMCEFFPRSYWDGINDAVVSHNTALIGCEPAMAQIERRNYDQGEKEPRNESERFAVQIERIVRSRFEYYWFFCF